MSCPSDGNTGFVELVGKIEESDLNTITVKSDPLLSISFKPRTTIPTLIGNRIDEPTGMENTCTYLSQKFSLVDVQICNVVNKNYKLPGITTDPVAELVLSFSVNKIDTTASVPLSGILLCLPIYDSGTPTHNQYLDRIINPEDNTNTSPNIPNLESIFYGRKDDVTQSSFAYMTCFETMNDNTNTVKGTRSLYVLVFPHGITLRSNVYQTLNSKANIRNYSYSIPAAIRGGDPTLKSSIVNNNDTKTLISSTDGIINSSRLSTCTDEFRRRFRYYTLPPRSSSSTKWNSEQCPYYKTNQYKCVPFNQSKDLSGELVIPGNKTLETVLSDRDKVKENATSKDSSSKALTTEDMEGIVAIVGSIGIIAIGCLAVGNWISKQA